MKVTDVAVAVFLKPDGTFLLSSRPGGKPYAGFWEFPGGKIETGESVRDALVRELIEELNVTITHATPWFTFMMHYSHATVRLHCWRVMAWHGEMRGMENQQFSWQRFDAHAALTIAPTLPGCVPIFKALALPLVYTKVKLSSMNDESYLSNLRSLSMETLIRGWRENALKAAPIQEFEPSNMRPMIQLCARDLPSATGGEFASKVQRLAQEAGAKIMISEDILLAKNLGAEGVQLTAAQLINLTERPDFALLGATVSTRAELARAAELPCDFAVVELAGLSSINWPAFAELAEATPLPCYASGALTANDLGIAIEHGAHGIVMPQ